MIQENAPKVICIGTTASAEVLQLAIHQDLSGYILEAEILYSLAWVPDLAVRGYWVMTPGIAHLAARGNLLLPQNSLIVDGCNPYCKLSKQDTNLARLALIFSMERRNLADELRVTENWGYGLVSALYKKMGLEEILSGELDPEAWFYNNPILQEHLNNLMRELEKSGKAHDLETLAYHLLTTPEITNII